MIRPVLPQAESMAGTVTRISSCTRDLARMGLRVAGTTLSWPTCLMPIVQRLERTNFRGRTVSLCGGVGVAASTVAVGIKADRLLWDRTGSFSRTGLAATIATGVGGCVGVVDDLDARTHDGNTPTKSLKGHFTALAHGRVTTKALKIATIGSGVLVSGVLLARHRSMGADTRPLAPNAVNVASSTVIVTAQASLLNLPDLRPRRAPRTACIVSTPPLATPERDGEPTRVLAANTLGVSLTALPKDPLEDTMLEDIGASAIDALLGTALAYHLHATVCAEAALSEMNLILTSEKVFFSRVINGIPVLAVLDGLERHR